MIAISFWILVISHYTPSYVGLICILKIGVSGIFIIDMKLLLQESEDEKHNVYSRFYISGRDIAAFFSNCGTDQQNCSLVVAANSQTASNPSPGKVDNFYSLIDTFGMEVVVDKVLFLLVCSLIEILDDLRSYFIVKMLAYFVMSD